MKFIYTFIHDNRVKPPWDQTELKFDPTLIEMDTNIIAFLKHDLNGPFGLINLVHVAPSITKL